MTKTTTDKPSTFDFGAAISQLFSQAGGRNFAIRLVLWTSVFMAAVYALFGSAFISIMRELFEASWVVQQNPDNPEAALEIYKNMLQFLPSIFFMSLLLWCVYASAETALHKRIFKGVDHGFIPLRFGRDELRVMAVQLVVYLMVFGVYLLGVFVLMVLMLGIFSGSALLAALLVGIVFFGFLAFLVYLFYFSMRMAPGAALSIATDTISITGGWEITKKRTGSLFLGYLFVCIAGYIVISVVQIVVLSFVLPENYMLLAMGQTESSPTEIFAQAADRIKQPTIMLGLVIGGFVYMVTTVIWWLSFAGIGNYAVQWWQKDSEAG